ncbi:MAG: hypothetical protein WC402_03195 [Candidatus Pacearchaeota archaeon]|jgi:hypothetical protein
MKSKSTNKKKKRIWFIGIVLVLILLIVIAFFAFPKMNESRIKSEIKKANYCEVYSDCVDAGSKCPFGCYSYVNKNEVSRISKLIESFDSNCVYGCLACPNVTCENKKCKEVCE